MLGWKTPSRIASSLMGLRSDASTENAESARCSQLRSAMLDLVTEAVDGNAAQTTIYYKLQKASEVQSLWYLRSDLMMFLSEHIGESAAMTKLHRITALFEGAVPRQHMLSAQRRRTSQ
jgi:hypothetical protein